MPGWDLGVSSSSWPEVFSLVFKTPTQQWLQESKGNGYTNRGWVRAGRGQAWAALHTTPIQTQSEEAPPGQIKQYHLSPPSWKVPGKRHPLQQSPPLCQVLGQTLHVSPWPTGWYYCSPYFTEEEVEALRVIGLHSFTAILVHSVNDSQGTQ